MSPYTLCPGMKCFWKVLCLLIAYTVDGRTAAQTAWRTSVPSKDRRINIKVPVMIFYEILNLRFFCFENQFLWWRSYRLMNDLRQKPTGSSLVMCDPELPGSYVDTMNSNAVLCNLKTSVSHHRCQLSYHQISNIRRQIPNFKTFINCLVLQLSLPNPLKPGI